MLETFWKFASFKPIFNFCAANVNNVLMLKYGCFETDL